MTDLPSSRPDLSCQLMVEAVLLPGQFDAAVDRPARWLLAFLSKPECRREANMTNAIESQELTRVGPGTAMGELMRQYWIPAAKSSEIPTKGDPLRLMLLGEKLIAFRDDTGRVAV